MYIPSEQIKVFPLAKARDTQRSSRIFYEETTSSIIRNFIDTYGFIVKNKDNKIPTIQQDLTTASNPWKLQNDLIFNIYGYYVTIKSGTDLTNVANADYIYATIKLSGSKDVPYEIDGQDDGGVYKGLALNSSNEVIEAYNSESNTINLILFKKVTTTDENGKSIIVYELYENSLQKIDFESFNITGIDGKN